MTPLYLILTAIFIIVAVSLILIILVQRPSGGGLAGAFGGAGGGGTESVFGGRVGDALTVMTVVGFCVYLGLAITLNLMESRDVPEVPETVAETLLPFSSTDPGSTPPTPPVAPPPAATPAGGTGAPQDGVFTPLPEGELAVPGEAPAQPSDPGDGSR